ncbi:copper resistance protein NlpE N-terminal domain-containing protein [Zymobacter sp. IVIA_12111.31 C1]|uniref:copper resistance protein NlpE N-terminal domain-containing protein n=1 Tax=Zymobacter sp. IVIA_12111.31 C1 TaxID=3394854 RepID=UPI0039C49735
MKQIVKWALSMAVVVLAGCAGSAHKGGLPEGPLPPAVKTQVYSGNLPCKHCSRIETRLVLNGLDSSNAKDHTFIMDAKYVEHEGAQGGRRYTGSWDRLQGTPADPSAEVINLLDQQTDPQTMFHFQQIDGKTLELIDGQLQRYENGRGLRLYLEPSTAGWRKQDPAS